MTSRPVRRPAPLGPAGEGAAHNAPRGTAGALGAKRGARPTMHRARAGMAPVPSVSSPCPLSVPAVSPGWPRRGLKG